MEDCMAYYIPGKRNIMSEKWQIRFDNLHPEIQNKLKNFIENDAECQLKIIKKTRPKEIKTGDVFVVSPRKGIYFYGRVQKANIESKDNFVNGNHSIFIYKCKSKEISLDNFKPNFNNLLIDPCIIHKSYWTQGYFYTIGNVPLTEEEKNLDYGFVNVFEDFVTEERKKLEIQPCVFGSYGITTIIGVAGKIEQELIIDPSLLEFEEGE
jgi:hypothetical protein